jgi:Kef-type K+ transport system membrane component KefB
MFLAVGMLAGADGPGRIYFDNAEVANLVGTFALAYILFSGGMDTNWRDVRPVLWRAVTLATVGVVVTAVLVGCSRGRRWASACTKGCFWVPSFRPPTPRRFSPSCAPGASG